MADGVGMVLGTSGFFRYWRRVISLTDVPYALARRFKAFLTNRPGQSGHAPHMAASIRLLAAHPATALVHSKDRGAAHAHQL